MDRRSARDDALLQLELDALLLLLPLRVTVDPTMLPERDDPRLPLQLDALLLLLPLTADPRLGLVMLPLGART